MKKEQIKIWTGEFITDASYETIKDIEFIKKENLKWVVNNFKKTIAGQNKGGKDILKGIEIIFQLKTKQKR